MMQTIRQFYRTGIYTILHFVVDGICAALVFSKLYTEDYTTCLVVFLLYNLFAFVSQPFVGIAMDHFPKPKIFLLISIVMLSLGYAFSFQYVLGSLFLGIGNSFFHVCGGKDISCTMKNDIVSLGVFVSTGAIGLMLGQRYYSSWLLFAFFGVLFLGSGGLLFTKNPVHFSSKEKRAEPVYSLGPLILGLLVVVVLIRSFVGKIIVLDFETAEWVFVCIAVGTALGKMLGGVVAKYIGVKKTMILSMVFSTIFLCLWNTNPYTLCLGIVFFNFSMPITLYYANCLSKGQEGFAFGLLAAALIPGYALGMLGFVSMVARILIACLSFISAMIICGINYRVNQDGIV
ncbi:MAG: hypothetical protein K2N64_06110 [Anaeroplasmataceae bacterium]|nr:hypothetical protein [Anaeroplasmataceae bacterium]